MQKGLVEKDVKLKWAAKASCFDIGLKILIIMTSLQNIVISGAHARSPDVDGIKIFDKDDPAVKHYNEKTMFCSLHGHL